MTTTIKTTKFYVLETNYVGPNRDQHVDADKIEISVSPAVTNMGREERTEGWCGTTNDWTLYGHGEYDTIEEAREEIAAKFGEVRSTDANGDSFESEDERVVETYKPGKYAPMSRQATADWAYDDIEADIRADTTDESIEELVAEYEAEANFNGRTLDSGLEDLMNERRQELRDEMEDEA